MENIIDINSRRKLEASSTANKLKYIVSLFDNFEQDITDYLFENQFSAGIIRLDNDEVVLDLTRIEDENSDYYDNKIDKNKTEIIESRYFSLHALGHMLVEKRKPSEYFFTVNTSEEVPPLTRQPPNTKDINLLSDVFKCLERIGDTPEKVTQALKDFNEKVSNIQK